MSDQSHKEKGVESMAKDLDNPEQGVSRILTTLNMLPSSEAPKELLVLHLSNTTSPYGNRG
jgi:hypothetical protein